MTTINNASFSFRVAEQLKADAFQVIAQYGFTPSQVFNLFLTEIANTKTIPVNLSYLKPNAETLEAINEARSGKAERYNLDEYHFFDVMQKTAKGLDNGND